MTLFRPESLQSQRQGWLGSIHVVQPVALRWLSLGALVALFAAGALLFLGEYTRKARLTGVLMPDRGLIRVVPAVAGTVESLAVAEGQEVQAGQPLMRLVAEAPSLVGQPSQDVTGSLQLRLRSFDEAARQAQVLGAARLTSVSERLTTLRSELAQLETQAALHQQRQALADKALARLEALGGEHFVSSAQVQSKAEEVLALKAEGVALARQRQALQRERAALEAEQREVPLQTAQRLGEVERERAEIAEASARSDAQATVRQLLVRAPADGRVTALLVDAGQSVSADAALASLSPAGSVLQAQLYAPSSALGFIEPGQAVWLRLQAFPYQKFGLQPGRVLQVARAPVSAAELAKLVPLQAPASSEPMYRVTVALARQDVAAPGGARPLLPGMQLEADVLLEKRRLVEWLFEPLMGWWRRV